MLALAEKLDRPWRARHYDPSTGRFLSQDPIGMAGGDSNFYRAMSNNPVRFRDPMGLRDEPMFPVPTSYKTTTYSGGFVNVSYTEGQPYNGVTNWSVGLGFPKSAGYSVSSPGSPPDQGFSVSASAAFVKKAQYTVGQGWDTSGYGTPNYGVSVDYTLPPMIYAPFPKSVNDDTTTNTATTTSEEHCP
ncbi:MAG: RHS repeat-associated core domain-containing protein [Bdellovibrionota bacterium]